MAEPPIPLGRAEDLLLEFKAADSLRDPQGIAREVVGMLNAAGGEVWVGLRENDGTAVAIDPIDDVERAERSLWDHLIGTIEPRLGEEVAIEAVPVEDGSQSVLRIRVSNEPGRRVYSYTRKGARYFGRRVGARLRMLSYDEIFGSSIQRSDDQIATIEKKWDAELEGMLKAKSSTLWLRLQPLGEVELDFPSHREVAPYFMETERTGNRLTGWTFVDPHQRPIPRSGRVVHGVPDGRQTIVSRNGVITFTVPIEFLHWKGPERSLWPYALIEFPVSIWRLAAAFYRTARVAQAGPVFARMALLSVKGWRLKAGSAGTVAWQFDEKVREYTEDDVIAAKHVADWADATSDNPDRCAYPLIRSVYEAFGFYEADIPREFDREKGLRFPS